MSMLEDAETLLCISSPKKMYERRVANAELRKKKRFKKYFFYSRTTINSSVS